MSNVKPDKTFEQRRSVLRSREEAEAVLFSRGKITKTGCLEYQGATNRGYGIMSYQGKPWLTHRLAWLFTNKDPGDRWVLHKCDNPKCFNPKHLFLGDAKDNCHDAVKKGRWRGMRKTHCKNGHKYTSENTVIKKRTKAGKANGYRYCRTCHRAKQAEYWRAKMNALHIQNAKLQLAIEALERIANHKQDSVDKVYLIHQCEGYQKCASEALEKIKADSKP